jgi:hypothetical protein
MESPEKLTGANEHDSIGQLESCSFGKADFIKPDCFRSGCILFICISLFFSSKKDCQRRFCLSKPALAIELFLS